jgi:uncharacterized protein (DUF433 family)
VADRKNIYAGQDPREVALYSAGEAANFLRVPQSTIRSWLCGHTRFARVLEPAQERPLALSFFNMVEAFVLSSLRERGLHLPRVRTALRELADKFGDTPHPLATEKFRTDGKHIFLDQLNRLFDLSQGSQQGMVEVLDDYLQKIDYVSGLAARLHPVREGVSEDDSRLVVIDPRRAFGRPVVEGTRIPVEEIAGRFQSGDEVATLVRDFALDEDKVRAALRCELGAQAA